jgi:hypothetical protein
VVTDETILGETEGGEADEGCEGGKVYMKEVRRARVLCRQEAQKGKQGLWLGPKFRRYRWDLRVQMASQENEVVRVHIEVSLGMSCMLRVCFQRGYVDKMFCQYQSRPGRERRKGLGVTAKMMSL